GPVSAGHGGADRRRLHIIMVAIIGLPASRAVRGRGSIRACRRIRRRRRRLPVPCVWLRWKHVRKFRWSTGRRDQEYREYRAMGYLPRISAWPYYDAR